MKYLPYFRKCFFWKMKPVKRNCISCSPSINGFFPVIHGVKVKRLLTKAPVSEFSGFTKSEFIVFKVEYRHMGRHWENPQYIKLFAQYSQHFIQFIRVMHSHCFG